MSSRMVRSLVGVVVVGESIEVDHDVGVAVVGPSEEDVERHTLRGDLLVGVVGFGFDFVFDFAASSPVDESRRSVSPTASSGYPLLVAADERHLAELPLNLAQPLFGRGGGGYCWD